MGKICVQYVAQAADKQWTTVHKPATYTLPLARPEYQPVNTSTTQSQFFRLASTGLSPRHFHPLHPWISDLSTLSTMLIIITTTYRHNKEQGAPV